jgi:hypothetical protein
MAAPYYALYFTNGTRVNPIFHRKSMRRFILRIGHTPAFDRLTLSLVVHVAGFAMLADRSCRARDGDSQTVIPLGNHAERPRPWVGISSPNRRLPGEVQPSVQSQLRGCRNSSICLPLASRFFTLSRKSFVAAALRKGIAVGFDREKAAGARGPWKRMAASRRQTRRTRLTCRVPFVVCGSGTADGYTRQTQ